MNNKQRTALVVGLVVIVVMGLFPPYTDTTDGTGGYRFLFHKWIMKEKEKPLHLLPPRAFHGDWAERERIIKEWVAEHQEQGRQIDGMMLLIQWVIVAAATGIFVVVLSDPYRRGSASRLRGRTKPPTVQTEDEALFDELFCYHCGKPIEEGQSPCPACGKEVDWSEE